MTPTELAEALESVCIANEEEDYEQFQSDAAIVSEAAEMLRKMAEEIHDLRVFGQAAYDQIKAYSAARKRTTKDKP